MTELPYLAATDAIAKFRARELSPVELMTAVISRAEELERAGLGFGGDPGWRPSEPAGGIGLQAGRGSVRGTTLPDAEPRQAAAPPLGIEQRSMAAIMYWLLCRSLDLERERR